MTTQSQLDAILHGAAFAEINDRGFLRITGSDATRWLNGMVTNNIAALAPGEGNYNFLLNAQGRIQGDCTIYREPTKDPATFLLETQNSQLETVNQTLDKFIIMDDVELTRGFQLIGHTPVGLSLIGPRSGRLLHKLLDEHISSSEAAPGHVFFSRLKEEGHTEFLSEVAFIGRAFFKPQVYGISDLVMLLSPPNQDIPSFELWFENSDDVDRFMKHAIEAHAAEVSAETLEAFRIYSGTPKYGIDIRDRDLPQETAQTHALHFAKGCYLGQEIVERIRSRGNVHRTFTRFTLIGSLPTELPTPLEANAKPAGEITSAAQIGDTIYALGYARREALDTHATLTYPGGTATPLANWNTGKLETGSKNHG